VSRADIPSGAPSAFFDDFGTRMIDAAIVGLGRGKGFLESVQGKRGESASCAAWTRRPMSTGLAARHGFKPSSDLAEALSDPAVQALRPRHATFAASRAGRRVRARGQATSSAKSRSR